jgi:hypothetical protein
MHLDKIFDVFIVCFPFLVSVRRVAKAGGMALAGVATTVATDGGMAAPKVS